MSVKVGHLKCLKAKTDQDDKKSSKKRGILDDDDSEEEIDADKAGDEATASNSYDPNDLRASDEFEYCGAIKASHKIKAFVFLPTTEDKILRKKSNKKVLVKVACALSTNTIETYSLEKEKDADKFARPSSEKLSNLTSLHGHPTGVRAIALSSNDFLEGSSKQLS